MAHTDKFVPSAFQQAVFDWVRTPGGHLDVAARAGSGKTKTIEQVLPFIPEDQFVTLLAFNNKIAGELKQRIIKLRDQYPDRQFKNVSAKTFHSLGYGAVRKFIGGRCQDPDGRKLWKLCDNWLDKQDSELYASFIIKLVGFARGEGIGTLLCLNTREEWARLIDHHDMLLDSAEANEDRAIILAQDLLGRSVIAAQSGMIDFDDMLYLPILWNLRIWQNNWVLVDEAQDTSPVRRELVRRALKGSGRSIWVGDEYQAINGFAGASNDAMSIIRREFKTKTLPLSICYRCDSTIVEEAQGIVPDIRPADTAAPGVVESIKISEAMKVLDQSDAILCRQTAPLVSLAFALIARGRGCVVLGRDIGAGLVAMVKAMKQPNVDLLVKELYKYCEIEAAKFRARGDEAKATAVEDKVQCVLSICSQLSPSERDSIPTLISAIESVFSDVEQRGLLTLATIHKAKGLEWNRVAILKPELMPSSWARKEWQFQQEMNLLYVAMTRARHHLMYLIGDKLK